MSQSKKSSKVLNLITSKINKTRYLNIKLRLSRILLGLLLLLLLSFLFLIFLNQSHQKILVQVNEQGFSPANVFLNQGDEIIFQNTGNWEHWPASNIHPTHQIYPEFDPKESIKTGKSWSFTFNKSGVWRFHDHLLPNHTGQITVLKSQFFVPQVELSFRPLDWIANKWALVYYRLFPDKAADLVKTANIFDLVDHDLPGLKRLISVAGPKKVLDKLLADSKGGSSLDCHQPAHQIGRLTYQVEGANAFKIADQSCHSGYMHGAMESFLKDKGTDNLAPKIDQLCNTFKLGFPYFECLHGVGHGVMAYEDYDMPKALKVCRGLKDDFSQSSCFGGVFMENVVVAEGNGATPGHSTKWVSNDPHFPCSGVDQARDVQFQCYLMQTSRMLDLFKYDLTKVSAECLKAPSDMQVTCFASLGRDIAGMTLHNPQKINDLCSQVPSNYFTHCLRGALFVVIEFWGDNMTDQPHQLCKIQTDPANKSLCYQLLGGRLTGIFGKNSPKINQVCGYGEPEYVSKCVAAAND